MSIHFEIETVFLLFLFFPATLFPKDQPLCYTFNNVKTNVNMTLDGGFFHHFLCSGYNIPTLFMPPHPHPHPFTLYKEAPESWK